MKNTEPVDSSLSALPPKDGLRGECPRWRARWLKLDAVSGVHSRKELE